MTNTVDAPHTSEAPDVAGALEAVLRDALNDPALLVRRLAPFGNGHSGETLLAEVETTHGHGPRDLVLRLSPAGVAPKGPADVGRQGRIMSTLYGHGVPVPCIIASSSTPPTLAGRSFAVMELVHGRDWSAFADAHSHDATAAAAVHALQKVQALPTPAEALPDDVADLDPAGEVNRWTPLVDRSPDEFRDGGAALRAELVLRAQDATPVTQPVIVHGDYHYANLLFDETGVAAVLDWEISNLGHPLTDLACLAVASMRRRYEPDPNPTGNVDVPVARLAELYGCDLDVFAWHVAASCFKYAAIIGYNLQLHRRGKKRDPVYESLQDTTRRLHSDGLTILRNGLDRY